MDKIAEDHSFKFQGAQKDKLTRRYKNNLVDMLAERYTYKINKFSRKIDVDNWDDTDQPD